ncbi:CHAT domain-containing protein [Sorangium cellulosum]|uniref:nSTAND1 domain-containing NTPase n=1 Tax=Sorangium cellulosum TaxID=56 RepID=UPI001331BF9B|nr:CHAT domain-containing protein [Sorangium cellulosum]
MTLVNPAGVPMRTLALGGVCVMEKLLPAEERPRPLAIARAPRRSRPTGRAANPLAPLELVLDFTLTADADGPVPFGLQEKTYLLQDEDGGHGIVTLPWGSDLLQDLSTISREGHGRGAMQHVGAQLRDFLEPAGWASKEAVIVEANQAGRRVHLSIRSSAAELHALPWELLTLRASGRHLAEFDGVLLRYEWPGTYTVPEEPSATQHGGRIVLAWSAAGGRVSAREHSDALTEACAGQLSVFDPRPHVLADVSYSRLNDALDAARITDPIAVLHILCHAAAGAETVGLALRDGSDPHAADVVDANRLGGLLAPHAGKVRLVVLSVCTSGAHVNLGSIAQAVHRAGVQAVVASRFPLSVAGSVRFTEAFYGSLLGELGSVERAFLAARSVLARDPERLDWTNLMLYARGADGADTRPIAVRPYRGLSSFRPEYSRFFFGREHEIEEVLDRFDALNERERPRLVTLVGPAGVGTTSIALAGVVSRLVAEGWTWLEMRPGSAPNDRLHELLSGLPETTDRPPCLLLVDASEEVFMLVQDPVQRAEFARRLWELAHPSSGISVLITFQSEFLPRLDEASVREGVGLADMVKDRSHRVLVGPMSPAQLRQAIEAPAQLVGLSFEDGLVDRLLDDAGERPDALPSVESALDMMWQMRRGRVLTHEAYRRAGELAGARERYLARQQRRTELVQLAAWVSRWKEQGTLLGGEELARAAEIVQRYPEDIEVDVSSLLSASRAQEEERRAREREEGLRRVREREEELRRMREREEELRQARRSDRDTAKEPSVALLLVHEDDRRPVLEDALPLESVFSSGSPLSGNLSSDFGVLLYDDPDDRAAQRWGVVAPEGPRGDRLLDVITPLRRAREAAQGTEARIYRFPSGLEDAVIVRRWIAQTFWDERLSEEDTPRYVLLLGDADEISLQLQQQLAIDAYVGRLAFRDDNGYGSYVDKVLRWEGRSSMEKGAHLLCYTALDDTVATVLGYRALMRSTIDRMNTPRLRERLSSMRGIGDFVNAKPTAASELMQSSREAATVLFTLSNGLGAPRKGWRSWEEKQAFQGAMSLGSTDRLSVDDVGRGSFLPGGAWLFLAGYSAGTEHESVYRAWALRLRKQQGWDHVDALLSSRSPKGDRPFIAALPQAALANPDGPLAVFGLVDLAWISDYVPGNPSPSLGHGLENLLHELVRGSCFGAAHAVLSQYLRGVTVELSNQDGGRDVLLNDSPDLDLGREAALAHLWLLREHLASYILLGDPAARLPIVRPAASPPRKVGSAPLPEGTPE